MANNRSKLFRCRY